MSPTLHGFAAKRQYLKCVMTGNDINYELFVSERSMRESRIVRKISLNFLRMNTDNVGHRENITETDEERVVRSY